MITKANVCAAIAWAKENPDKIISGVLARDAEGEEVLPTDPSATCFCILGRVAKRANLATLDTYQVTLDLAESFGWDNASNIWVRNDEGISRGLPLQGAEYLESLL